MSTKVKGSFKFAEGTAIPHTSSGRARCIAYVAIDLLKFYIYIPAIWVNVLLALSSLSSSSSSSLSSTDILRNDPCVGLPNEILTTNPRGCKYFFYCRNGEAIEGFCPNNMWFNFDAGICDQPKNVFCTFDVKPPKPDSNEPEHADEETEDVSCPTPSTTNGEDSQMITYIPSKTDCGRYFICYHGQPIKLQCTEGLHWSVVDNKCDQPINAHCQVNKND